MKKKHNTQYYSGSAKPKWFDLRPLLQQQQQIYIESKKRIQELKQRLTSILSLESQLTPRKAPAHRYKISPLLTSLTHTLLIATTFYTPETIITDIYEPTHPEDPQHSDPYLPGANPAGITSEQHFSRLSEFFPIRCNNPSSSLSLQSQKNNRESEWSTRHLEAIRKLHTC